MSEENQKEYSYIAILTETKTRLDKIYFELKKGNKTTTFNDLVNMLIDNYEATLETAKQIHKEKAKEAS